MCLFWKAIGYLYDYGFRVNFCLFDGASANRSFLKLLFHPLKPLDTNMTIDNLNVIGETVVLGMDVKHVINVYVIIFSTAALRRFVQDISTGRDFQSPGTTGAVHLTVI